MEKNQELKLPFLRKMIDNMSGCTCASLWTGGQCEERYTNARDVFMALSRSLNLIEQTHPLHHDQVAYLSYHICEALETDSYTAHLCAMSGLFHDIPALMATSCSQQDAALCKEMLSKKLQMLANVFSKDHVFSSQWAKAIPNLADAKRNWLLKENNNAPMAQFLDRIPGIQNLKSLKELPWLLCSEGFDPKAFTGGMQKALGFGKMKEFTTEAAIFLGLEDALEPVPGEGTNEIPFAWIFQIVQAADVVSMHLDSNVPVLNQKKALLQAVDEEMGDAICPEVREGLAKALSIESTLLDMAYNEEMLQELVRDDYPLTFSETRQLTRVMSKIIDFRSPYTAVHSAGVSACAVELARDIGFDERVLGEMEIAGNLHDLGKLKVPNAILEKPGKLTDDEFGIIKEHSYYTWRILSRVEGFERISTWAGLHHEKPNGFGYPFHLEIDEIPDGARLMASADVFSAITEDRPYRRGMDKDQAARVLQENVGSGALDKTSTECLLDEYEEINEIRQEAQEKARHTYRQEMRTMTEIPAT